MNCEIICQKALEIGLTKNDIELKKEAYNGWRVLKLNNIDEIDIKAKELQNYINKHDK